MSCPLRISGQGVRSPQCWGGGGSQWSAFPTVNLLQSCMWHSSTKGLALWCDFCPAWSARAKWESALGSLAGAHQSTEALWHDPLRSAMCHVTHVCDIMCQPPPPNVGCNLAPLPEHIGFQKIQLLNYLYGVLEMDDIDTVSNFPIAHKSTACHLGNMYFSKCIGLVLFISPGTLQSCYLILRRQDDAE